MHLKKHIRTIPTVHKQKAGEISKILKGFIKFKNIKSMLYELKY